MNKIIGLRKLKNDRYIIEIEEKGTKVPHIITENTIIKHNLLSKDTLTKEEYKKIIKDNEYELLYLKAINYISYQMRTISEVKKHLNKDTKNNTLITKIIDELKKNRYLNDKEYVQQFVNEKKEFDLVGPRYIKEKLIQKGIHFDLISEALLSYNEHIQFDKIYQLISKEIKYKQKKPYQKVYLSLKQKLITKGFNLNIIESSLLSRKDDIKLMIDEEDLLKKDYLRVKDKYDLSIYEEKNRLIKKLMSKGHNYETVKVFINKEGTK
ncbi:Regulatory protein RecX [Candidatus Izimaplasma bacterium HR1]|jgi:regulatory protein|uniref:RecX family transcriptional regulator n=1 Tax=Candidatus Izimoplasma sp. HR1 TaxID=1541959 RepID=UPI0004F721A8|nr:Regulatory protein RecX [Candidatus Izimaplasma bacterium HR1]